MRTVLVAALMFIPAILYPQWNDTADTSIMLPGDSAPVQLQSHKRYAVAPASTLYKNKSKFERFLLGKNYSDVWSVPVPWKVFRFHEEKGGLSIEKRAGSSQHRALTLKDRNGQLWTLRPIEKDLETLLPEGMQESFAANIAQKLAAASHPYAPVIAYDLARAAGMSQVQPEYFFVPNDPALGCYQSLFANKIALLEPQAALSDSPAVKSTITVIQQLLTNNRHRVMQRELLKARLLDILIADWNRHADKWKWEARETAQGSNYSPIINNHDQAFFYSDGLLLWYAGQRILPFLKGFRYNIPDVEHLGYSTRHMDRLMLNELDKNDWEAISHHFIRKINDSVITHAVKQLPAAVFAINGEQMIARLKNRRKLLPAAAMDYYKFLSEVVTVLGSNETEYFTVTNENNKIRVKVLARISKDSNFVKYDRLFDPAVTKEIRLYGFNGSDYFNIEANSASKTFLRIIGGTGIDTFAVTGTIRNYVYDLTGEKNILTKGKRTIIRFRNDPRVNHYDYNAFEYDINRWPRLNVGFNIDDGLLLGAGWWYQRQGFRKRPYASDHRFSSLFALGQQAIQLRYRGSFTDVLPQTDLVVNAEWLNPVLSYFFGFGNNTVKRSDKRARYYRVRYKYVSGDVLLKRKLSNTVSFTVGPTFFHYWNKQASNKDYILAHPAVAHLDSLDVYAKKTYAGGKIGLLINNLNSELLPANGMHWYTEYTRLQPLSNKAYALSRLQSDMALYASIVEPAKFVAVMRVGGGHIFSDEFEYFQAIMLGANNFLRGFRKNRFAGSSSLYGSVEFRIKLAESKNYILPGQWGLILFNDLGRVWYKNEVSRRWHHAYGGGLYYTPFQLLLVSATVAASKEEILFNCSIGTVLNLSF